MSAQTEESFLADPESEELGLPATMRDVAVVSLISIPLQLIATDLSLVQVLAGLAAIYLVCLLGVLLTRYVPFRLPSVAWISLVGIAATLPMLPWGQWFLGLVEGLDFLALAVPPLAYAGLAISKLELDVMRRSGWKLLLIAVLVFLGTYLGSAVIAEVMLRITG